MGPRAFEVVGMPLKNPGLYVVELESAILGTALLTPPQFMYVPTAVLVTNLSVHFKWGRNLSHMSDHARQREPVKDATVTIRDCQKTRCGSERRTQGLARIETSCLLSIGFPDVITERSLRWTTDGALNSPGADSSSWPRLRRYVLCPFQLGRRISMEVQLLMKLTPMPSWRIRSSSCLFRTEKEST
jgi:hypothetical protein